MSFVCGDKITCSLDDDDICFPQTFIYIGIVRSHSVENRI